MIATIAATSPSFMNTGLRALAATGGLRLVSWTVLPPDPVAQGPGLFIASLVPVALGHEPLQVDIGAGA